MRDRLLPRRLHAAALWTAAATLAAIPAVPSGEGLAIAEPSVTAAVRSGDLAAVQDLLAAAVDVNEPTADGTTALHWAVHRDDPALVELLLDAGAEVSVVNRYGVMPLMLAVSNGHAGIVDRLLRAGADSEAAMPGGETALMAAARTGAPGVVRILLESGANQNVTEQAGQIPLMWAAAHNNADAIELLVTRGADVHARTPVQDPTPSRSYFSSPPATGFTPLLFAVRGGQLDATRVLLDAGANVNDTLSDGQSALVVAVANANWELANYLLDRGADPTLAGAGWNALHQTVRTRRPNPSGGLAGPIPTGRVDSIDVVRKLIAHGVDVDTRMTRNGMKDGQRSRLNRLGATAFFLAAKNTDVEAMRVLIDAGADAAITSADGTTPLMVAAGVAIFIPGEDGGSLPGQEHEVLEAVQLCVELGTDVNAVNERAETALHGAAFRGVNAVVDYLVDHGAKLDAKTVEGWTPLALANGLSYSDFYKAQVHTADRLRELMQVRGLETAGHGIDPSVCLDCFQTRPDQVRAAIVRDGKMAAELAAGLR
ncbi:MAG: ankyrin repeat domain-containing protein [Acidobacteriota bacterium]|nr:ankyrin repeat domain-containing protein [Acidobacteriota bacterium]